MKQIKTYNKKEMNYWINARGVEYDIQEMSDDYVWNCINFLQTKVINFKHLLPNKAVTAKIKELSEDIKILLKEMNHRNHEDIEISREDGCERY